MQAHCLGHATWLIETSGGTVLTDPVFFDPFEGGAVVSCPGRSLDVDALPKPDYLFLSHRHLDHFDRASLVRLDRALPVFHADDPMLSEALGRLGFTDLRPLTPWEPISLPGGLTLLPTPSDAPLPEVGLVLQDPSGKLFDQVDTVLLAADVRRLRDAVGRLDVHLSMFASQNFGVFLGEQSDWTVAHAHNLNVACGLNAQVVVPASGGFRFADDIDWLNRHLFPVAPGDFEHDLKVLLPEQVTVQLDPGDSIEVGSGAVTVGTAPGVLSQQGDLFRVAHDPSAPVPALVDDNASGHDSDLLEQAAAWLCTEGLGKALARAAQEQDPVLGQHLKRSVVYRIGLVGPSSELALTWIFEPKGRVRFATGVDAPAPTVRHDVAASALLDLLAGTRPLFWTRTRSRRASLLRDVQPSPQGAQVQQARVPDLLHHALVNLKAAVIGPSQAALEYHGLVAPAEPDVRAWVQTLQSL
jgi:L-ascorbate metabolism protein UlaG (beta-lactamase superfamily)